MKALLRITWLNLLRDRVALVLTFLLPIAFFTIFALIFGGMGSNAGPSESRPLQILAVDLDDSVVSRRLVESLDAQAGLEVATTLADAEDGGLSRGLSPGQAPDREAAARAVRAGQFSAALVIPAGFGAAFPAFGGDAVAVELIYDPSNPIAEFAVGGMLQAAAFTAAPDILFESGIEALEEFGGELTPAQREAVEDLKALLADGFPGVDNSGAGGEGAGGETGGAAFTGLVAVDSVNVRSLGAPEDAPRRNSMIAYYAAGMGVMFLLFSMTGAAGSILEEEESGALERLLMSRTSLTNILAAKWLFFALLGFAQVSVMFVYGNLAFGLPLWTPNYLVGFVVVASVTALAASAFGLLLAALCRSRTQLSGLSTIIILIMSAVGGSMVPRFIMPDAMDLLGRFTFNGWALDAFLGVFWHDDPGAGVLQSLGPVLLPVAVMLGMMAVFLGVARLAARRWETV